MKEAIRDKYKALLEELKKKLFNIFQSNKHNQMSAILLMA